MPTLFIIDAHAYLHRAYHALPPLTTSKGEPVNAIYGFMRMIMKIIRQFKPDAMAVCFDTAAPTFRHQAYEAYKATRKETDQALVSQFPIARDAIEALSLAMFEKDGFEADDLMAHLAREGKKQGWEIVIVSGDKDALQLVEDGAVRVLNEPKDIFFDEEKVKERYGVSPKQIPDIFALMGDASDNVPGVPGIGEKTAIKLIQEHGDLEALLKAAPLLKGKVAGLLQTHEESARQSRALVTLDHPVPVDIDWNALKIRSPDPKKLTSFLQRLEFLAMLKEFISSDQLKVDTSKRQYSTILKEADLKHWVEEASASSQLAVDVETTGLDALSVDLVGISMSFKPGSACYVPLRHQDLETPEQLPLAVVQRYLCDLFKGQRPKLYGHNLKYDAAVLKRHGMELGKLYFDTMVASYVLNPSRNNHGLKELSLELLGEQMTSIDQLIGKGSKQVTIDQVPVAQTAPYACADADMTLRLARVFEPLLHEKKLEQLFHGMEMPLVRILSDMEEVGMRIDRSCLATLGEELRTQSSALEKKIHALAGESFNVNSPKQLAVILFEKLKLPVIRKTKTGFSTDEDVLQKLSSHHALPKLLIEYRELQKMNSTYVEGLLTSLSGGDDRVHSSFNQTVAATGRLSSSDPNLQNIPIRTDLGRKIRRAFIPREQWVLLSADYSQIDLRMLAHISQDEALCRAFKNGEDIHTMTASEIFGVKPSDVSSALRRVAKSINFGIVYGISAFGLARQLEISQQEAQEHIDRYFMRYPGVKAWIEKILDDARRDGYVRTLSGRIRYLPEIQAKNPAIRGFAERTAMNTPIQGTSADIIKLAMIRVQEAKGDRQWSGEMLVQVHDELLFEIPPSDLKRSAALIKSLMETAIPLSIPVIVDLKAGENWSDMKPF